VGKQQQMKGSCNYYLKLLHASYYCNKKRSKKKQKYEETFKKKMWHKNCNRNIEFIRMFLNKKAKFLLLLRCVLCFSTIKTANFNPYRAISGA
jgi:hypothetical protein